MIATALRLLFPPVCAVAERRVGAETEALPAEEARAVDGAATKRREEFAAGRAAARAALAQLGCGGAVIGCGPAREPRWPAGFTGSIAHAGDQAVAVAARADLVAGLGLDLERDGAVREELWPQILTPLERARLDEFPPADRAHWATVVFCAKEAYYKLQYLFTRQWVEFGAVDVNLLAAPGQLLIRAERAPRINSTSVYNFPARFAVVGTFVIAGLYLPVASTQFAGGNPK